MRVDVASAILAKNKRNIVLTDASKFGKIFPTSLGLNNQFAVLNTSLDAPQQDISELREQGIEVLLV